MKPRADGRFRRQPGRDFEGCGDCVWYEVEILLTILAGADVALVTGVDRVLLMCKF